jgi:hypothetical protein
LGLGALLGLLLGLGGVALAALSLPELLHLLFAQFLEPFVVGITAHTHPFSVRAKNHFGGRDPHGAAGAGLALVDGDGDGPRYLSGSSA